MRVNSPIEAAAWIAGLGFIALFRRNLRPRHYNLVPPASRRVSGFSIASQYKSLPLTPSPR